MLRTLENILGYRLVVKDGEIGKVHDFFFDDVAWKLRYLVVETGNWLNRRRVLVSPSALGPIDGEARALTVMLTHDQVQSAPDIDTDKPVSRQQELMMNAHYGWPAYWSPEGLITSDATIAVSLPSPAVDGDQHLRSFREISSYGVNYGGIFVAKVQDFVIDDEDWSLKLLIAVLGGWLDSRQVAVPVSSIYGVSWTDRAVTIGVSKEELEALPSFEPGAAVNREEKVVHFDYYGRVVTDDATTEQD